MKAEGKFLVFKGPQFQGQGYRQRKVQNNHLLCLCHLSWVDGDLEASLSYLLLPQTNTLTPAFSGEASDGREARVNKKYETLDSLDPSP